MNRLVAIVFFCGIAVAANAQYTKCIERIYALPYDSVWKASKAAVTEGQWKIITDKKKDGILETDVKMVVESDSIIEVMNQFGEVPFIPSADWKWGQNQVKLILKQVDTVVHLKVFAALRSFDQHTINKWAYFDSNGKIENDLFDEVEKKLGR